MEKRMDLLMFLMFFSVSLHLSSSCPDFLQFISTANTPGTDYTVVGELENKQIMYYDGNSGEMITKTDWMEKIQTDDPDHWRALTRRLTHDLQTVSEDVNTASPNPINTEGDHMLKEKFGCEQYNNGTVRRFWKFGYDGEDLISLNLNDRVWTAETRPDEFNITQWKETETAVFRRAFLQDECIDWLQMYMEYKRAAGSKRRKRSANNWCKEKQNALPPADAGDAGNGKPANGRSVPGITPGVMFLSALIIAGVVGVVVGVMKLMKKRFDFKAVSADP